MSSDLQTILGIVPKSHIYILTLLSHIAAYHGDTVIILPEYRLSQLLSSVQCFKINVLPTVS